MKTYRELEEELLTHLSPNDYCWNFGRYIPQKSDCEHCKHANDCIRRREAIKREDTV